MERNAHVSLPNLSNLSNLSLPAGGRLPAAWEPHAATIMAVPHGDDLWFNQLDAVRAEHDALILAIASAEDVVLLVPPNEQGLLQSARWATHPRVKPMLCATDDVWLRDTAPVFARVPNPVDGRDDLLAYDFMFNAWGEKFHHLLDDGIGRKLEERVAAITKRIPFVFEGGSLDCNGAGVALTTRQCLLEPKRNPAYSERDIDALLKGLFGLQEVVWLDEGIVGDHTDGHIDTIARFVSADTVVCHYAESKEHPSYLSLKANLDLLEGLVASGGSAIKNVIPVPVPKMVELFDGTYKTFSYVNFYACNAGLLVPQFGDANDQVVLEILSRVVTDRKVIGLDAKAIILGGGVFNCLTQHVPAI